MFKKQKMEIINEIKEHINERYNGRFLRRAKKTLDSPHEVQYWVEISAVCARDKIGHALRFADSQKKIRDVRDHIKYVKHWSRQR